MANFLAKKMWYIPKRIVPLMARLMLLQRSISSMESCHTVHTQNMKEH